MTMKLSAEIMEEVKKAKDREALKQLFEENRIAMDDAEINEIAWQYGIPHGANCPCCKAMFWPLMSKMRANQKKSDLMKEERNG